MAAWPPGGWTLPLARRRTLRVERPLVMGILNVTPDSFSDGGRFTQVAAAVAHAGQMLRDGADLIDVGGESTRPGHAPVAADEEQRRVVPVLAALRAAYPDAVLSIDTTKAAVAQAALAAGADLVNDVSGLADAALAGPVRDAGCALVLMRTAPLEGDLVPSAQRELAGLMRRSRAAGIPDSSIILDPGLGFGDPPGGDVAANLALAQSALQAGHGRPFLVGASRKRFIGTATGESQAVRRIGGSVAVAALAVQAGAAIVRVHDVKETVDALRVLGADQQRAR